MQLCQENPPPLFFRGLPNLLDICCKMPGKLLEKQTSGKPQQCVIS